MMIGKVMEQDSPWDIIIHDEEQLRVVHGTSRPLPDPLFVQLKEVYLHGVGPIELDDWMSCVRETVRKAAGKYKGREPIGILHLYNRLPFHALGLKEFEDKLSMIKFDFKIPFKQISITVDTQVGSLSWQIFPEVHAIGSLGNAELPKLKELFGFE